MVWIAWPKIFFWMKAIILLSLIGVRFDLGHRWGDWLSGLRRGIWSGSFSSSVPTGHSTQFLGNQLCIKGTESDHYWVNEIVPSISEPITDWYPIFSSKSFTSKSFTILNKGFCFQYFCSLLTLRIGWKKSHC